MKLKTATFVAIVGISLNFVLSLVMFVFQGILSYRMDPGLIEAMAIFPANDFHRFFF